MHPLLLGHSNIILDSNVTDESEGEIANFRVPWAAVVCQLEGSMSNLAMMCTSKDDNIEFSHGSDCSATSLSVRH